MKDECRCFNPRNAAVALVRWGLGLLFLLAGAGKLAGGVSGFVHGYLLPAFASTFLPTCLLTAYGYALPFVETALGILLLLGIARNLTLFMTGLTLLSLAFGQMLLHKTDVVFNILGYLFVTGVVLFLAEYDQWKLCCRSSCGALDSAPSHNAT